MTELDPNLDPHPRSASAGRVKRDWIGGAAIAGLVLAAGIVVGDLLAPGPSNSLASVSGPLQASVLSAIAASESRGAADEAIAPEAQGPAHSAETAGAVQGASASEAAIPIDETTGEGMTEATELANEGAAERTDEVPGAPSAGESGTGTGGSGTESGAGAGAGAGKAGESSSSASEAPLPTSLLQRVKHVWVIMLSGASFKQAVAQKSSDPYLAKQLLPKGALLSDYSLVAASPLANDIALLSGQSANAATEADCPTYEAVQPSTLEAKGLTEGIGCVYPAAAKTLADQVSEAALNWRAYIQDMAPAGESAPTNPAEAPTPTCRRPTLGETEAVLTPTAGADYLTSRNPFVYFDSLLEAGACESDDVDLTALAQDLAQPQSAPALSWIAPSACDDGQQTRCGPQGSSGLAAADAFLREVVPQILATKAYHRSGLLLISFDQGPATQAKAGEAGAVVGALLLSPFVKPGASDAHAFDDYSLLKSLERLYGVPLLGHANDEGLEELGAGVYSTAAKATQATAGSGRGAMQ